MTPPSFGVEISVSLPTLIYFFYSRCFLSEPHSTQFTGPPPFTTRRTIRTEESVKGTLVLTPLRVNGILFPYAATHGGSLKIYHGSHERRRRGL